MAEALVSFVLEKTRDAIWQKLEEEAKLVLGVDKQVKNLTTTLLSLQDLLKDADLKQVNDADIKAWLEELKDITYDADDVLDEWRTKFLLSQLNPVTPTFSEKIMYYLFSPCSSHIPTSCSCFIPDDLPQHHQIATEIQGINERLVPIDLDNIRNRLAPLPTTQSLHGRVTTSLVNVAEICGRDDDKKTIVDWLHGDHSSCTSVPVLAIVGTGGFGKTTLAQIVLNHEKTKFELPIWVCVSEPFDHEKVAKEIIEQATGNKPGDSVRWGEALHQQLSDSIKGKQFLIVLDDVWSRNRKDWDPFRLSLNGGAQGSRVIVTTRNKKVAMMTGSSKTHRLGGLSNQDCWLLFQQIAFAERTQEERETLKEIKEIGEEIAAKCKGVPLAAKTIASVMRFKQTKKEWRDVLKSDIWEQPQGEEDILPSLLLSYHDLLPDLKQCFLYCAIFPKDARIKKDWLVKLWMAQGFLRSNGVKELETIGEEYFDELAMRSFFQDFEKEDKGDRKVDIESPSSLKVKKLRSLILRRSKPVLSEFVLKMTCLRSLDLSHSKIEKLPDEVDGLLHLRYLDLSNTRLTELPETMCNLYNLQTLRLNACHRLRKLPEEIGRLLNLRHLECQYVNHLSYFPRGIGKLKRLRTLHMFVVSNASGGCKLEELKDLNSINGELEITGLRQVKNIDEAKRAKLHSKENIVSLRLDFRGESEENENNMKKQMEEIIEGLQPHNNLERLVIGGYPGLAFPSWITMSNITELDLYNFENCTQLPALGKLPYLVTLEIRICNSIKQLGVEFLGISESGIQQQTTFPKLTSLKLESIHEWEEEEVQQTAASIMPDLRKLSIGLCKKLKVIPNYLFSHNLKELEVYECPELIRMPSLESLDLIGDVPIINASNNNHNLESFALWFSPQSSLPQGLNHFKSLQELVIGRCQSIYFDPEEELSSEHFPNLRKLEIYRCRLMRERCSRVNWSNLSHISEILVDGTWIRG